MHYLILIYARWVYFATLDWYNIKWRAKRMVECWMSLLAFFELWPAGTKFELKWNIEMLMLLAQYELFSIYFPGLVGVLNIHMDGSLEIEMIYMHKVFHFSLGYFEWRTISAKRLVYSFQICIIRNVILFIYLVHRLNYGFFLVILIIKIKISGIRDNVA